MKRLKVLISVALWLALASAASGASPTGAPEALKAYRGFVTYVDFWASWCAPCAESFPWLNAMHAKYAKQGLRIVGVGLDSQAIKSERFLKAHPAQFPILADPEGKLAEHFAVEGMPYAVILDADGKVLHRHSGYRAADATEYEQAIKTALSVKGVNK